jgi:hypothetical protein
VQVAASVGKETFEQVLKSKARRAKGGGNSGDSRGFRP